MGLEEAEDPARCQVDHEGRRRQTQVGCDQRVQQRSEAEQHAVHDQKEEQETGLGQRAAKQRAGLARRGAQLDLQASVSLGERDRARAGRVAAG